MVNYWLSISNVGIGNLSKSIFLSHTCDLLPPNTVLFQCCLVQLTHFHISTLVVFHRLPAPPVSQSDSVLWPVMWELYNLLEHSSFSPKYLNLPQYDYLSNEFLNKLWGNEIFLFLLISVSWGPRMYAWSIIIFIDYLNKMSKWMSEWVNVIDSL